MTTPKTVTIKKAKRSTMIQNKRHLTTMRIGDINVVDWRWSLPSDVFRYKCSHSIKADALLAPAFARMKVYTDLFWVSLKSIMPDFYEKIPNFDMQQKTVIKDGTSTTSVPYYFPHEDLKWLSAALKCSGTFDHSYSFNLTIGKAPTTVTGTFYGLFNFERELINTVTDNASYNTYMRAGISGVNSANLVWDLKHAYNVSQLCSQMGFPAVVTRVAGSGHSTSSASPDSYYSSFNPSLQNSNADQYFFNYPSYYDGSNLPAYLNGTAYEIDFSSGYSPTSNLDHRNSRILKLKYDQFFSTLPFKAYQKIYNEWFINSITTDPVDLYPNTVSLLNKSKFVNVAINYTFSGIAHNFFFPYLMTHDALHYINSLFQIRQCWYAKDYFNTASGSTDLVQGQNIGSTVLDLRKANAIQRLLEKRALVGGNRIFDFIAQHWSFFPDNIELDRPLHLGSDTDYINIGEVLQTSETTTTSAQGDRAGTANAFSRGRGVLFNSPDYGIIMCLCRIVPEIDYFSGLERKWRITNTSDWPLPELAQIGFQAIYNNELTVPTTFVYGEPNDAWAYAPRYSEWKDSLNQVSGEMQTSRLYWHQSPDFKFQLPGFNTYFGRVGFGSSAYHSVDWFDSNSQGLTDPFNSYLNNIFAITDNVTTNHFVGMFNIECTVNRALPTNDMPQL